MTESPRSLPEWAAMLGDADCSTTQGLVERDPRVFSWPAVATEGARVRLKRWVDAGQPPARRDRLRFYGCQLVEAAAHRVLAQLPEPHAHFIVERVVTAALGASDGGWSQPGLRVPVVTPGEERPHLVVIAAAACADERALEDLIAHEWGHAWTADMIAEPATPEDDAPATLAERREARARLASFAVAYGMTDYVTRPRAYFEKIADALAGQWLARRCVTYQGRHREFFEGEVRKEAEG